MAASTATLMQRLYSVFVWMLLIPAIAAGCGWIYSLKHDGSYRWSQHIRPAFQHAHPFLDDQGNELAGCALSSFWYISWEHAQITLGKQYFVEGYDGYDAPPGFPMDEYLANQYKRNWTQRVNEQDQSLNHHGFHPAFISACDENTWWGRHGVGWENSVKLPPYPELFTGGTGKLACTVPVWAIFFLLLVLPALKLTTLIRRRRRIAAGKCVRCGYDLRASPGRCPECGLEGMPQGVTLA